MPRLYHDCCVGGALAPHGPVQTGLQPSETGDTIRGMSGRPKKRRGPIGWLAVMWGLICQSPILTLVTLALLRLCAMRMFAEWLATNIQIQ